jgi:hypothetical protein
MPSSVKRHPISQHVRSLAPLPSPLDIPRCLWGLRPKMIFDLLLFLQKQSLAFAVYLFGIGTLLTGPGLKKNTCDNALTMTSPVHW